MGVDELAKLGAITFKEVLMAVLAILALALWIGGGTFINATTVTLVVISLMLITGVLSHDDILSHKKAWDILIWFGTLVALADGLNKVGFVTWFAKGATVLLAGMSPVTTMVILVAIFFFIHYMFASLTAHTAATLPVRLCGRRRGAGDARKSLCSASLLLAGIDGHHHPICYRSRSCLFRKWVHQSQGLLAPRLHLGACVSHFPARYRGPLVALYPRLVICKLTQDLIETGFLPAVTT